MRRRIGAFFMTTLKQLESTGYLQIGDSLVLNEWGAQQVTKAINKAKYSQTLGEGTTGVYEGNLNRLWVYDKRRVRFALKGAIVTLSIHEGVDYFKEVVRKV